MRETGTTDRQPGSWHHVLLRTLMQSMIWCTSGGCTRDTQNYASDHQGHWYFVEVSGPHHIQRHSAKVLCLIKAWSGIQQCHCSSNWSAARSS